MITINLIINSIGLIFAILNIVDAVKNQNTSAKWGWICCSMYMLADIIRLASII